MYWQTLDEWKNETGSSNKQAMKMANKLVKMGMPKQESIEIAKKKNNDNN